MFWVIAPFLTFSAFLLLLLVSLSVPIIHSIYLFRLSAHAATSLLDAAASGVVRFGVWGYCISTIDLSIVGLNDDSAGSCSHPKLGYTFDSNVQAALNASGVNVKSINKALTAALVLHPIACGFSFLTLLASLFIVRWRTGLSRGASFLTLGVGLFTALLTTVVFLVDVIFVAIVKSDIKKDTDGSVTGAWGNAVWMVLGATVALWAALVGVCVGLFRGRRKPRGTRY
ncbi:uncharacterized protein PHACADRAFT_255963 [Phanerochaete carnosa HHB-10118-sp]|uniref:Pali-domain-containing protein n=1 Tax=Phanerochaete carnosa (strain HHB-10118-sp) TaxID=650164 RepID=K5WY22_PHACS|nr:uncharacterized protein PHACADRAFT_255963 [Phanerochaete carnosa HHB-10118-sp]EKM55377.1 hypothetical protein PHACADRAFT_255963 [Phanerochaete carnosa HHB-10118-sp]